MRKLLFALLLCGLAASRTARAASPVILSEFMADNTRTLEDEEGSFEDWIEIYNAGFSAVNLDGWYLTDSASDLTKWRFPATNLNAGSFLVVFASEKDRQVPGAPLHTSFKLSASGEYLALVQPDGVTIATEFAPVFPRQVPDVSFGFGLAASNATLVAANAPVRVFIPTDGSLGVNWMLPDFDDTDWTRGTNGVGYDTGAVDPLESSYSGQVLESQPLAYWRLGETTGAVAADSGTLGASANGTYQGGVALGIAGPRPPAFSGFEPDNAAAQFDGANDFVGGPNGLLNDRSAFTLAGWIRPTGTQAARTGLFGQNDAIEFGFINATTIQLWTFFGSLDVAYPFLANEWHHVAAVGTGQALSLYFDGKLAGTSSGSTPSYGASSFNFNLGGGGVFDAAGNPFLGQIDEVSVWNRALTAVEIARLLQAGAAAVDFAPHIATNVRADMQGINSSAYLRIPFVVANPADVAQLTLRLKYDDGFVAWLNGQEIARKNAPATLSWNSTSTARRPDNLAIQFEDFNASPFSSLLQVGTNMLAIQGLNIDATNVDFLIQAELVATSFGTLGGQPRYFLTPTPGALNSFGAADLGPLVAEVSHTPAVPLDSQNLLVTARVLPTFNAISNVTLYYRIMFGSDTPVAMNDSGANGDVAASDGLWSAIIPASASTNGQMIRYYVSATDAQAHGSRWPLFPDPINSERYLGTVVFDPNIQSALPVVQLFVENTGAADTFGGTRCSLFYLGEFYDNVLISLHGQSSSGFPKKSYNLDFNSDHRFKYRAGSGRVKDIKFLTNYGDKSKVHNALAYEMIAAAGSAGHFAFQARLQRNAQFFSIADVVEDGDDVWLERLGRDPSGALYKMYNNLGSASGEKKTRKNENFSDLQALVSNLDEARALNTRVVYAYDNLDLPQTISYFVGLALISSQDHGHKNYYVYRDTLGSGEWAIFPWDIDLSWGRNWTDSGGYFTDMLYQDNVLNFYNSAQQGKPANRLYNLIFNHPDFRRMYLRRLRTVIDQVLQAPNTPTNSLRIEARIREMMDLMDPPAFATSDADRDYAAWPKWGNQNQMRPEAQRIIDIHLPGRRAFLFTNANATVNGERIPSSQPTNTVVTIAQVEFNPASGDQAQEYIQLTNSNGFAVDLSGWRLGGGVSFTFRPGTVIPASGALYVSPNVNTFRARASGPRGGQGLYVQGNYRGQLNAWGESVTLTDDVGRLVTSNSFVGNPSLAQRYLRITEIMYNPAPLPGNTDDAQAFEFIELKNIGPVPLDLSGVRFTNGVSFNFTGSAVTHLAPGATVLVVKNPAAFAARYGSGFNVAGQFTGTLDNAGETIRLEDAVGEKILEFAYNNAWYPLTDGLGFSLVIVNEQADWATWGMQESWRASSFLNGSPGATDPNPPAIRGILVNEALTHTDPPQADSIELFNPTTNLVDIGGWFLTDDLLAPKKYRIPSATRLQPGAFAVFSEAQFNAGTNGFALSSDSDEVWLFSGDANSNLTGYYHGFAFGAAQNGVSFGRYVNSQGEEHFVAQTADTLGASNALPKVGPVVISEIMYHPPDLGTNDNDLDEYIELQNLTSTNIALFDPAHPTNTWRLRDAVDFDFPANVTLPPGGRLLVVGFDPATNAAQFAAFRTRYRLGTDATVLGAWTGKLDNSSDELELKRPDTPNTNGVPYILVEKVAYRDAAPWPAAADGLGNSLQRRVVMAYGNDSTNWFAAAPTPDAANTFNQFPTVTLINPTNGTVFLGPTNITLSANATDADGAIARVSFFDGTNKLGEVSSEPFHFTWTNAPFGTHTLTAQARDNNNAAAVSPPVTIQILSRPPTVTLTRPASGANFIAGANVVLVGTASDPDTPVSKVEFFTDSAKVGESFAAPFEATWIASAGAHTLTAVATDSSGVSATSAPVIVFVQTVLNTDLVLVAASSSWKYLDNGSDQGTNWINLNFNDSTWRNGVAELGYGDAGEGRPEATVIGFGTNANNKYITYYFRQRFVVDSLANVSNAVLRVMRDDGAVAYLNGVEVFRSNMTNGPINYLTRAVTSMSGADEATFFSTNVSPSRLVVGQNILAVEVHQQSPTSSDVSFAAELTLNQTIVGPAITTQPRSQTNALGGAATFTVAATGTAPLAYQWRLDGTRLTGATNATLTLTNLQTTQAGAYTVVVTNTGGAVTGVVATLTVVGIDTDGDGLPDAWEIANGLDPNSAAGNNGAAGDPDGDGFTNLQEYLSGTDPRDSASYLKLDAIRSANGAVRIRFIAVAGKTYTLLYREHIVTGSWLRLSDVPAQPSTGGIEISDSNIGAATARFYRLVTPQLP